ncbi:hypothetical protein ACFLRT_00855 [Acidobacteriota bacterium]
MSYEITITDLLKQGRIDVKRNGEPVGYIDQWNTSKKFTYEIMDEFTIDAKQTGSTSSTPCPVKISSLLGYDLSFKAQGGPEWKIKIIGPPPSPETDVNVTVGEDEPPD